MSCLNIGVGRSECGPCPKGYEGDGQTCNDIDEVCETLLLRTVDCPVSLFEPEKQTENLQFRRKKLSQLFVHPVQDLYFKFDVAPHQACAECHKSDFHLRLHNPKILTN